MHITQHQPEAGPLTLIAHALPALAFAIVLLPLYVVVPNAYGADLGLSLAMVGQILFAVRVVDALSDPIIGYYADRTGARHGRRKLWLAWAVLPATCGAIALFMPPQGAGGVYLFGASLFLSLAMTAALIPYQAWSAELSTSYQGRARVAAFREGATALGTLLALLVQGFAPLLAIKLGFELSQARAGLTASALLIGLLLPLGVLIALRFVPEPLPRGNTQFSVGDARLALWRNKPFLRLILVFLINGVANGFPASLFLFYVGWVLNRPDLAGMLLVIYFVSGIVGVPFWLWLAKRWSKHRAWALGMLLAALTFPFAMLLQPGDVAVFAVICVLTGFVLGADIVLPASIQADAIDVDTAQTGIQRTALYVSLWAFASKLALALAVGIALPILAWSGFDPGRSLATPQGLSMLAFLYAGLPSVIKLAGVFAIWRFPLDAEAIAILRARIEAASDKPSAA